MATLDIFNNRAFDMVSLTNMVNIRPYEPNYLQSLNLPVTKPIRTTTMAIEKKEGKLSLIPTSQRGEPLEQGSARKRDIRNFNTVRIAKGDTIWAEEVQNVRADGSETELKQIQREVMDRTDQIEIDMNLTEENLLLGMVQGIVMDADGTTVLNNWFTEWGVVPPTVINWNLGGGTLADFRMTANALKRRMYRSAKGLPWNGGVTALCGDTFYDRLTTHTEIEKTYLNYSAASELRTGSPEVFQSFPFAGINWVNYRGTDDQTVIKIADNEVKFFPTGGSGIFFKGQAPGESWSSVNTRGKRRYSMVIRDRDRDMWVKPEVYTYPLYGCLRPEMLESGVL